MAHFLLEGRERKVRGRELTHPTPPAMHESGERSEWSEATPSTRTPVEPSMGCLYRIVCHATGRSYVGQTSYSHPFERFLEHQRDAQRGAPGPLYEDLRVHGVHAFECIPLCVCRNDSLNALECYYAEQYNAYVWEGGYNVGECGRSPVRAEVSDSKRLWMKRTAVRRRDA